MLENMDNYGKCVRSYDECLEQFRKAAETGTPLIVTNPPEMVAYAGIPYVVAMIFRAAIQYKSVSYRFICNCGDHQGWVQQAFSLGVKEVLFSGNAVLFQKLSDIAEAYDAVLIAPKNACSSELPG